MKDVSLPPLRARRGQIVAALMVLALALCAPLLPSAATPVSADEARQAAVVPLPFDAGTREGTRQTEAATVTVAQRDADPTGIVVDLEPIDPDAEPLTGTRLQHPAIRLHGEAAGDPAMLAAVRQTDGVALATPVLLGSLTLTAGEDDIEVEVAGVDPESFRLLTPQVTAEAVEVWRRISEGDAAFVHEVGHDLRHDHGVALGDRVPLAGGDLDGEDPFGDVTFGAFPFVDRPRAPSAPARQQLSAGAGETLRVGAYASNGAPPVADVLVSHDAAETLGLAGERMIVVALDDGADARAVAEVLEEATGLDAEVVPQPSARRAFLSRDESLEAFEPFTYVSLGDGMIQIERDWVRRNIVSAQVPIFRGHVTCHRLMIPQLRGALQEIEDAGLAHLIDPSQYGGCWVPRHILFNPRRGLSMHAWGLAIDFNVSTNQYGARPQLDRRIVDIFERWGFDWGGHWSTPDGMHFELAVLLDPGSE